MKTAKMKCQHFHLWWEEIRSRLVITWFSVVYIIVLVICLLIVPVELGDAVDPEVEVGSVGHHSSRLPGAVPDSAATQLPGVFTGQKTCSDLHITMLCYW